MIKKPEKKKVGVSKDAKNTGRGDVEQYHRLFDHMAEGYAYCRMIRENGRAQDWIYIQVNDSFERLTGLKGVGGKRATEVMPDIRETHPELFETCSRVSLTGQPEKLEVFMETLQAWFSVSVFSPAEECFAAIFYAITEHKETEAKLRERMEYFRTVANFTYDWEYWLDDNRRILYTSPSCERITGYSAAKFEQDPSLLERIIHHDDRTLYKRHIQEEMEKAEPISLDFRIITTSGDMRWISHACQRVHDVDGRPMGRRASNRDVTQRRQIEQALRESESILSMSEEVAQMGSWRWDLRTKKAAWSDQMFRMFEVEREDFDGDMNRVIAERVHPDDATAVLDFNRSILTGISSVATLTYRIVLPDGRERTLRAHGKLVRDDAGRPISMTGYVREVTEWVKVKNQLLQMKRLYAALSRVNQTIMRVKNAAELYPSICDVVVKYGELAAAWIEILDETSGELRPVAASRLDVKKWPLPIMNMKTGPRQNRVIIEAFRASRVATSEDVQTDERTKSLYKYLEKLEFHSLASIPFQLQGKTIGVLNLASGDMGFFKAEEEISLLEEMGLDISFALEKIENEKIKHRWADAFEHCAHGIAIGLPTGPLITCNTAFARQQGRTVEEISSMSILDMYEPSGHEYVEQRIAEADDTGRAQYEANMIRKDGSVYSVQTDLVSVRDENGQLLYRVATQQDVSERKHAARALLEEESILSTAEEVAQIGSWRWDLRTQKVTWSEQMFRLFGVEQEGFDGDVNHIFSERIHPDDKAAVLAFNRSVLEEDQSVPLSYRIVLPDGTERMVWAQGKMIRDESGQPVALTGYVQDITERVRVEQALRESEEKMRSIFRVAPTGIGVVKDRALLDVNSRICEMTGYTREELIGQSARILYPSQEDFDFVGQEKYRQIAQKGTGQVETRWQKKDGSIINILLASTPIDIEDHSKGVTFTALDITERKRAEESIRQSERQMKALVTSLDDIVFEFDEDGTYLNIWAADESLLAQPKAQMLGKQLLEIMGEEHGILFYDAIKRVLAEGTPENIEYPLSVIGGQRWFMARISPIVAPNGSRHTASVLVRDITGRKKVEEQVQIQLRRMRALNEIDRAISSSLDMRLSLDILLNQVLSQLEVDAASILLLNPPSQTLEYEAGKGFRSRAIRESRMLLGQGFAGQVGLERKVLHIPDVAAVGDQFLHRELLREEEFVEYFGVPLIAKGILKGVLEIFHRARLDPDLEWMNYMETLGRQAAIAIDNAQLFEGMQRSNLELVTAYDATIEGWSRAMDLRDKETEGHTLRVTEMTVKLAKRMGCSQQEITHMRRGALLHDIGKLGVPDHILHKMDELDRLEWAVMRQHPSYAFNMLLPINYLRPALDIPYCHHEKWDGSGYPRGLKGGEIPLAARIFAIVDVWDALRSDRPYRIGWTSEQIREHLIEESGKHFDPQVVKAFLDLLDELRDLY